MNSGLPLRSFPFDGDGVTAVVTTRHGGVSSGPYASLNLGAQVGDDQQAVRHNRGRVAAALGVDRLTIAAQQHTSRVAVVDRANAGRGHTGVAGSQSAFPATDGLITDLPGTALAVVVADCAPVVLFDPVHRADRGRPLRTHGNGARHAPEHGRGDGGNLRLSARGPAGGHRPGHPGRELRGRRRGGGGDDGGVRRGDAAALLKPTRPGHCTLDVVGGLRIQLRRAGVKDANVHDMGIDTRTAADEFFSHRAERPSGRFAAVALLPS